METTAAINRLAGIILGTGTLGLIIRAIAASPVHITHPLASLIG